MAYYDHGKTLSLKAGSAMGQGVVVHMPLASPINETVIPAASVNHQALGLTIATVGSYGHEVAVLISGIGKARAAASLGAGAPVGAASTNGALGPVVAASAGIWAAGRALTSAAAGEYFACLVGPRQIVV